MKSTLTLLALLGTIPLQAATISLASQMNGNSFIHENMYTGGFSRINLGNGTPGSVGANTGDRDGHYLATAGYTAGTSPNPTPVGTGWDLFPREENFLVGNITFDESLIPASGTTTVPITAIDLGEFWKSDPNRTNGSYTATPTILSDISDRALGLWFFGGPGGITFGALEASDTVTFVDGQLTSINLNITTTFSASGRNWIGTFGIDGNNIAYSIDATVGGSRLIADISGTVNSVGTYAVPEPSTVLLSSLLAGSFLLRRRRVANA
ncbi:MAG: PEP-CTERM sorting domain-containing protein [Verrucomicrobiaceae bacterium]|nr:MAG: PEP-CTERM sorting domain-containing protein [Verrucomicrobiaceae bacterium]